MAKDNDELILMPMGKVLLLFPLGFAIWYVPLIYADTIGLFPAILIIVGILAFIITIGMVAPDKSSHPDHDRDEEPKTYTV
jgi:hypothetical protein